MQLIFTKDEIGRMIVDKILGDKIKDYDCKAVLTFTHEDNDFNIGIEILELIEHKKESENNVEPGGTK